MSQFTITVTFAEFKIIASDFFKALPGATKQEASVGFDCLALAFLGLEASDLDVYQAEIILNLATRELALTGV